MVSCIVAMDKNNGIGIGNQLPWKLKDDLKYFKNTTNNNVVIMGRKTYESIGKPLLNRENIVISRNDISIPGVLVFNSISSAIEYSKQIFPNKGIFIIGGAEIYKQCIEQKLIDTFILTKVDCQLPCDVFFPELDLSNYYKKLTCNFYKSEYNDYDFNIEEFKRA